MPKSEQRIEYNRDSKGNYWKVTKQSYTMWNIVKREKISRVEWQKYNKGDRH